MLDDARIASRVNLPSDPSFLAERALLSSHNGQSKGAKAGRKLAKKRKKAAAKKAAAAAATASMGGGAWRRRSSIPRAVDAAAATAERAGRLEIQQNAANLLAACVATSRAHDVGNLQDYALLARAADFRSSPSATIAHAREVVASAEAAEKALVEEQQQQEQRDAARAAFGDDDDADDEEEGESSAMSPAAREEKRAVLKIQLARALRLLKVLVEQPPSE